jgi:hypothetical protein
MTDRRSEPGDTLLLIAATAIAVLTLQQYFQSPAPAHRDTFGADGPVSLRRFGLDIYPSAILLHDDVMGQ